MGIKKKNLLWALLFPLLYMVILWNLTPFVYGIVDDRTMMEVVSGQYLGTPDPHTIFIGYWYSCLVAGLYRLIPNVDWYALGFLTLQGICLGMMVWRLLKEKERPKARIYTLSLLFLLSVILRWLPATQSVVPGHLLLLLCMPKLTYLVPDRGVFSGKGTDHFVPFVLSDG